MSIYSIEELTKFNFLKLGKNNKISTKVSFFGSNRIELGDNIRIDDNCVITAGKGGICIGDYVHIGANVNLGGAGRIVLENYCGISHKCTILSSNDDYSGEFMTNPCVGSANPSLINVKIGNIRIGKHAIIGCHSVVLPDCNICEGASIGALSLVNRPIDVCGIYHGNPVKFIKEKSTNFLKLEKHLLNIGNNLETTDTSSIAASKLETTDTSIVASKLLTDILREYNNIIINEHNLNCTLSEIGLDSLSQIQFREKMLAQYNISIEYDSKLSIIIDKMNSNKVYYNINNNNINKNINNNNNINKNINNNSINPNYSTIKTTSSTEANISRLEHVSILGVGSSLPLKKIDNSYYEKFMNTSDEWIKTRTGMQSKYILSKDETLESIIKISCENAIINANIKVEDIDLLVLASSSQEDLFGDASKIAHIIGATNAFAFDIKVACNGFPTAVITAEQYIKSGNYNLALVIGADCLSRWVNWSDKNTSILFGDGSGAVVLGHAKNGNGILGHLFKTDGIHSNILNINTIQNISTINNCDHINNNYSCIEMEGTEVFTYVINNLPIYINKLVNKLDIKLGDIDYFVFHQANSRILEDISNKLHIEKDKLLSNISEVGNTSAASIPILLDTFHNKHNKFKKGDLILIGGFGAGMSMGLFVIKWGIENTPISNKKVVLITGGTKGIGLSIANKLFEEGYEIIVISRNQPSSLLDGITFIKADICNIDDLTNVHTFIKNKYGKLDVLVNNAGWEGSNDMFIDTSLDDIHSIININLLGTLNVTSIMNDLLQKVSGTIINMSSIAAYDNIANCYRRTLYSSTKSAISTFTRGLSGELKNKCKIYSINPTFVETDLTTRIASDLKIDKNNLNKFGIIEGDEELIKPEEIAYFIYLLINEKTRYISGDEIILFSKLRSTFSKYFYETINNRKSNLKLTIHDIEYYNHGNMNACIFQGQGIDFNKNLNDDFIEIILENKINEKLINICNISIVQLIENYNVDKSNTYYQQLLVYLISICEFETKRKREPEFCENVCIMAGYSIGEISALVCAGFISFEYGLQIVNLRGFEMNEVNKQLNAKMITIIGLEQKDIEEHLSANIFITNNINNTIKVVGGLTHEIDDFLIKIKKYNNVKIKELNVNGAYHTHYYQVVQQKLAELLTNLPLLNTKIKVLSNYQGQEYNKENFATLLSCQVCNRVEWQSIIHSFNASNIKVIEEFGPSSNYLKKLFK